MERAVGEGLRLAGPEVFACRHLGGRARNMRRAHGRRVVVQAMSGSSVAIRSQVHVIGCRADRPVDGHIVGICRGLEVAPAQLQLVTRREIPVGLARNAQVVAPVRRRVHRAGARCHHGQRGFASFGQRSAGSGRRVIGILVSNGRVLAGRLGGYDDAVLRHDRPVSKRARTAHAGDVDRQRRTRSTSDNANHLVGRIRATAHLQRLARVDQRRCGHVGHHKGFTTRADGIAGGRLH